MREVIQPCMSRLRCSPSRCSRSARHSAAVARSTYALERNNIWQPVETPRCWLSVGSMRKPNAEPNASLTSTPRALICIGTSIQTRAPRCCDVTIRARVRSENRINLARATARVKACSCLKRYGRRWPRKQGRRKRNASGDRRSSERRDRTRDCGGLGTIPLRSVARVHAGAVAAIQRTDDGSLENAERWPASVRRIGSEPQWLDPRARLPFLSARNLRHMPSRSSAAPLILLHWLIFPLRLPLAQW